MQPEASSTVLMRGAKNWVSKDRPDLAKNLLKKLILIEPNSQEALFMLGKIELHQGNPEAALPYLNSLEKIAPDSPNTNELRATYRLATTDKDSLEQMRELAQAGKNTEAEKMLTNVFPKGAPSGELGIEYYRIKGSSKTGFEPTQNELAALYKKTGDARYRLLQLELQTYRPEYVGSAIKGYESLSKSSNVSPQKLQEAWKTGLYKLPDHMDKQGAIKRFLAVYPDDRDMIELLGNVQSNLAERNAMAKQNTLPTKTVATSQFQPITDVEPQPKTVAAPQFRPIADVKPQPAKKQISEAKPIPAATKPKPAITQASPKESTPVVEAQAVVVDDPDIEIRSEALDALDDGDYELAEEKLQDLLTRRPLDSEVLGGMGTLRLRQGNPAEAELWFSRALQNTDEDSRSKWQSLTATAGFWKNMRIAKDAITANNLFEAENAINQALLIQPDDPDALAVLGDIKVANNQPDEAERYYRAALAKEGYNVSALRGLIGILSRSGRTDEAIALVEGVHRDYSAELDENPSLQAGLLREEAELYIATNRSSRAIQALETAVSLDPKDPWSRFSLAKLYISLNMAPLAKRIMQEGAALAPTDPDMHYAHALISLKLDDYASALSSLEKIPEQQRSESVRETYSRALHQYYFQLAEYQMVQGNRKEAIRIMSIAQTQARGDYAATEQVAEGWFKLDLPDQALNAMRDLPQPVPLETQVYFASMLNRAKQDRELTEYLPGLRIPNTNDVVTQKYRRTVQDIEFAMAGREYDRLMTANRPAQAQQLADNVLNSSQLSNSDYFKYHRDYFSRSELPSNAIPLLEQEKRLYPDDLNIRWDLAYAYQRDKQNDNAQAELSELLALTKPEDTDMRLRIAKLQQNSGDYSASRNTIDDLVASNPNNSDILMQAGNISRSQGNYSQAANYYREARTVAQQAPVAPPRTSLARQSRTDSNILLNVSPDSISQSGTMRRTAPALKGNAESDRIYRTALANDVSKSSYTVAGNSNAAEADRAIASLESSRSPASIETGLDIKSKTATAGTSSYNALEIPVIAKFPVGYSGQGSVHVDAVRIDPGVLSSAYADAALFGKIQAAQFVPAQPLTTTSVGANVGLGYQQGSIKADIGVVGLGFPVKNLVGSIRKGGDIGKLSYSLTLSRRPETGSQLSYAGVKDPVSGAVWGGVTNTGMSLYLSTTLDSLNVSAYGSYGLLRGKNVQNNDRLYLRAAVDHDLYTSDDLVLNLGLNANYMSYSKNLSNYTFGHGGYYSPQSSLSFSLPLELRGREESLSYQLRASLSYSFTRETSSPFYPTDAGLQALATAGPNFPSGYNQAFYAGGTGGGVGFALSGAAEYRVTPHVVAGGKFAIERSAYYFPNSMMLYLKYLFQPETGKVKLTPTPVIPYSQY